MLNIEKTVNQQSVSIALSGRLDTTTAPELEKAFNEVLDGATSLTLDFSISPRPACAFCSPRRRS